MRDVEKYETASYVTLLEVVLRKGTTYVQFCVILKTIYILNLSNHAARAICKLCQFVNFRGYFTFLI